MTNTVFVENIAIGTDHPQVFFVGPTHLESLEKTRALVEKIANIVKDTHHEFILSAPTHKTETGLSMRENLAIITAVCDEFSCPVMTEIHDIEHLKEVANYIDVLQIPAQLCKDHTLLEMAAHTGRVIHIKRNNYDGEWSTNDISKMISQQGNDQILLCSDGATQYETYPIVFDSTDPFQQSPNFIITQGKSRKADAICITIHDDEIETVPDATRALSIEDFTTLVNGLSNLDDVDTSTSDNT
jgi:2-dehydro-3-deoxyphosphooctonate aldolase (KDO 8-P synthase)